MGGITTLNGFFLKLWFSVNVLLDRLGPGGLHSRRAEYFFGGKFNVFCCHPYY